MADKFHDKSKEAGNKLKENILNFSSVATGVFFFALTGKDVSSFGHIEKTLLLSAMSFFAVTVVLCLFELYVDSKRFFEIAKQFEKPERDRNWNRAKRLKKLRIRLINFSYACVLMGFLLSFAYMVKRIA